MKIAEDAVELPSFVLWESADAEPVAARVAIAGDFLPAGNLEFPADCGWGEMARSVARHFDDVDTTFVNLESAVDVDGLSPRQADRSEPTVCASVASLEYLTAIRARAVGIANNHIYDFGSGGLERTRNSLLSRGLVPLGAGKTLRKAPQAWIWRGQDDIRVGFWAAARSSRDPATRKKPGVETANLDRALYALECMRYHHAQFCVALVHTGHRGTNYPDPADVELMDSLAKWGFDIVCSSHSERISGGKFVEGHRNGPSFCFYGLGNLVSGNFAGPLEREGLIVVAGLNSLGDLTRVEVRPVYVGNDGFGEVPNAANSEVILNRFQSLSEEITDGTYERRFHQDVSQRLIDFRTPDRGALYRSLEKKSRLLRVRQLVQKIIG